MRLYVICAGQQSGTEARLEALARFLGLQVCPLSLPPADDKISHDDGFHVAATCESLDAFLRQPSAADWLSRVLAANDSSVFLTGFVAGASSMRAVDALLPGLLESLTSCASGTSRYRVETGASRELPQFVGLTFGPADSETDGTFAFRRDATGVTELITIDGRPCYVKVGRGRASYFLSACAQVLDLDAPAAPGRQPLDVFLQFVPFLAYLRLTFGSRCWHNEAPAACFIIDDPLLKERYGFLNFSQLESRMACSRFSLNIAFIPWNCRRTDATVAQRFKRQDRRFSISVHGCDHTEEEFGSPDGCWLRQQARLALERMSVHENLTGIRHNRVMIFPQGVFSRPSLQALHDAGFVAAVNSTLIPVGANDGELTFRDLLDMAVDRFGGVPLFHRHYPDRPEKTALDVFLGNQVLLVEHHGFFRQGYEAAARYASFVNRIAPTVTWTDLEEACGSAALMRHESAGQVHVRAFGPTLHLTNRHDQPTRYLVTNRWGQADLQSIKCGERDIDFERGPAGATCSVLLNPGESRELRFQRSSIDQPLKTPKRRLSTRAKVFARRHLCEARDNYLSRSPVLNGVARVGKSLLPRL